MERPFRIGIISPYSHISAMGVRHLSACLKQARYECRLIFLPNLEELLYLPLPHLRDYPANVVDQVCQLCADLDLVGMSVMSNSFGRARTLTQAIHERFSIPVIWGGIHPTVMPDECLKWANLICVGEGEEALVELVNCMATGQDYSRIPNIWLKDKSGRITSNPIRPLNRSLDALPLPDYELSQQYILHQGQIVPLTQKLLAHYMLNYFANETRICYMIMMTRGCPYNCTYCSTNALNKLYSDWRHLRRRSFENVIAELDAARKLNPSLEAIMFVDDTFLALPIEDIRRFSEIYREHIGLPFFILASPGTISKEKLSYLVKAGLQDIEMGIQTGGHHARTIYHRVENSNQVLAAARCLQEFHASIPYPRYDIISDNPYEIYTDQLETLRLLYELPRPFRFYLFSLTFYPGTELYQKAKADGLIQDDERDIYLKNHCQLQPSYYNIVLWCIHLNLPHWLLWLLIQPLALKVFGSKWLRRPVRTVWSILNTFRIDQMRRKPIQQIDQLALNEP